MLYGEKSKEVQIKDLLNNLPFVAIITGEKNDYEAEVIRTIKSTEFENENQGFLASDDERKDGDDGNNPGASLAHITAEFLDRYRKYGPFGKLHNIGVYFRQSSQLQEAFRNAQHSCKTPLAWIYNVATRWSSDYAMAIRALELRISLTRLFADIEAQGVGGKWSDFLANRLKPEEWQVIKALQRVLKHFDITYK
jgi:hypothetical protein